MRSLFWRILATLWLALALVAGLAVLLAHALQQDAWILRQHPGVRNLPETWTRVYENHGEVAAQALLEAHKQRFHIDVQVIDESGRPLVRGTFPPRAAALEARLQRDRHLPWRRLTEDYTSPASDERYLFIYRIPHGELFAWQRGSLIWPVGAILLALVVLAGVSLLLTLSITRPLNRLRGAVHDLGQTAYQQNSLAQLGRRRDELGLLARDFNRMGARLQSLIQSQRQLLRDVSHELRSPLARLRIATALAERASDAERETIWPRLSRECDRLEALIAEILELARLDADPGTPRPVELAALAEQVREQVQFSTPERALEIRIDNDLQLSGWPDMLQRALENLVRNALRFGPPEQPVELAARRQAQWIEVQVRDHGPGAAEGDLAKLGTPFFRAPGQTGEGHGLGLAIARRAAERHGGRLLLANHPDGGFVATLQLPPSPQQPEESDQPSA